MIMLAWLQGAFDALALVAIAAIARKQAEGLAALAAALGWLLDRLPRYHDPRWHPPAADPERTDDR